MADPVTHSDGPQSDGQGHNSGLLRYRDDKAASHAAVTVDAFVDQDDALAVRIEPGDEARELIPHLARVKLVEVNFPAFGDGRGYSAARILREAGYDGELRAVGDVLVDQLAYMRRCGFDSFDPDAPLDAGDVEAALARWPDVYQSAADDRTPIWTKRHA
ncbi:DUF934 domain-containing protein [Erythrobacter sp. QSSC1-22B]|uniref:DUF934 domain-containing protein n=1 Tax=Erythrobacter sp. QSSC1-22B TaxID=1860125 RepID=UPI0009F16ADD|nr:DUF934 domain-containing protein [Erythrobacter sp. QSSC1-22B]